MVKWSPMLIASSMSRPLGEQLAPGEQVVAVVGRLVLADDHFDVEPVAGLDHLVLAEQLPAAPVLLTREGGIEAGDDG